MLLPTILVAAVAHIDTPTPAAQEAPFLTGHVQLTKPAEFLRAGEAYFDHEAPPRWVIFQAIPRPPKGTEPDKHYSMYVAKLTRNEKGAVTGLEQTTRISPPASYNTCGWFHPTQPGLIVWGSTLIEPKMTDAPGYARDRQRYSWQFPVETEIVRRGVAAIWDDAVADGKAHFRREWQRANPGKPAPNPEPASIPSYIKSAGTTPLFARDGYDAEGSFSRDGRYYLYTHVDPKDNDPNLWAFDTQTKQHAPLVMTKGYDGGPFFHPDFPHTPWIVYRSDRRGDNHLQLFAALVEFTGPDQQKAGEPFLRVKQEVQLTHDADIVNWCPYFSANGSYLVFASSAQGHQNYEVYALKYDFTYTPADTQKSPPPRARVTFAPGFDGLPVFSIDGKHMMWTSQRGEKFPGDGSPSSQLWLANVTGEPAWSSPASPAAKPAETK